MSIIIRMAETRGMEDVLNYDELHAQSIFTFTVRFNLIKKDATLPINLVGSISRVI